jgi:hypothetical protein
MNEIKLQRYQYHRITEKERSFFIYATDNYVRLKDKHIAEGYDKA